MNRSQVRPVKTIHFRTRPLTSHALSWSCDADLAVANGDTIYCLFPEYPQGAKTTKDSLTYQWSLRLELAGVFHPYTPVNSQLCEFAGVTLPHPDDDDSDDERNSYEASDIRDVTGRGGSISQIVKVEWSPSGLGVNLRPILMTMTTNGELLAFGEHKDPESAVASGLQARNNRMWKLLWGLGAGMPIPAEDQEGSYRIMDERITSFSWAHFVALGRSLLAYKTDEDEVVIMSVHYFQRPESKGQKATDYVWQIREVARFAAAGPHTAIDYLSDDYTPHGSAFALRWSPWTSSGDSKVAFLACISRNYVGLRKVTIKKAWKTGKEPKLEVGEADSVGICLNLQSDAFIEWEDQIFDTKDGKIARGIICSPFEINPFQVDLASEHTYTLGQHSTSACDTTYSMSTKTNPITDIIIHTPESSDIQGSPVPLFSLVRSSITASSNDWFETNVPEVSKTPTPTWVSSLQQTITRLMPRAKAVDVPDVASDEEDTDDDFDDVEGTGLQVHPYRYRCWGMAASSGGGSSVILVSKHNTNYPSRKARCRMIFGGADDDGEVSEEPRPHKAGMTTEGKMWEWMYGNGEDVPGVTVQNEEINIPIPLKDFFQGIKETQACCLCDSGLQDTGDEARCLNGHSFAICTSSGLAILAPGISRVCAVCQRRCLQEQELRKLIENHLGEDATLPDLPDSCGGCGGKFVV